MWRKAWEIVDTTGRIPLWLIGTVAGIPVIGLIGIFILRFIFRVRLISVVIG